MGIQFHNFYKCKIFSRSQQYHKNYKLKRVVVNQKCAQLLYFQSITILLFCFRIHQLFSDNLSVKKIMTSKMMAIQCHHMLLHSCPLISSLQHYQWQNCTNWKDRGKHQIRSQIHQFNRPSKSQSSIAKLGWFRCSPTPNLSKKLVLLEAVFLSCFSFMPNFEPDDI